MPPSNSADAVRLFHEALAADQNNDLTSAFRLLVAAISADPTLSGAWNNLGLVLNKLGRNPAAVGAFWRSHCLAPDSIMSLANYAWTLHQSGRSEEALDIMTNQVIPKEPEKSIHWVNLSQVNLTLNRIERALPAAERAVELSPGEQQPRLALALAQLRAGQYAEGLKNFEARMFTNPILNLLTKYPYTFWRGENISDKRLFIPCEQGLGDSVMMLPFVIAAAKLAKEVVVHTHAAAVKFYQRNLPTHKVRVFPTPCELPSGIDFYCPIFCLPTGLQLFDEEIPAAMHKLKYAPVHFSGLERKEPNELRVGIAWAGDPNHDSDRWRSSTLETFLRLAEVPNVRLYSLQVGARSADLDTLGVHGLVKDLSPYIRDVNDTACLISQHLDVVVTVDTSVGHIAGAMGKRCYELMGARSVDWRWRTGEGVAPWYPQTMMFRQKVVGDWSEVVERVKVELAG